MSETNVKQDRNIKLDKMLNLLVFASLCLFLLSPLIQIIREAISPHKVTHFGVLYTYPFTIGTINYIVIFAVIVLWLTFALRATRRKREGFQTKLFAPLVIFGILACWMYLSQTVNGFTSYAYVGESYRNESLFSFILYVVGYFFFGTILKSERLRKTAVYLFLASQIVVGVLVLIDKYAVSLTVFNDTEGMSAIFHQFNHYGYYLVLGILLSAALFVASGGKLILRILCAVLYILDNVILILNNTFGCYLAVIAALIFGMVVFALRRDRGECIRMIIVILAFVVITVVMRLMDYSNARDVTKLASDIGNIAEGNEKAQSAGPGRWALWKHTVEYIKEKPVFGWGVEGITDRLDSEPDTINDRPHNEYLQWAAFFGIPAALLYLAALCVVMFGMFPRLKREGALSVACFIASAGYIASAFFGNTMYYTAPFFFIFLGMCCHDRYYELHGEEVHKEAVSEEAREEAQIEVQEEVR